RISASTPAKVAYQGGPVIPLLNNAVTHYRELPGNVTYHDGPVMAGTMNVYAIFWEPAGWVVDPHYNNLIKQYYNDVGGSSLYNIMNQYTQNGGGAPTSAILADSWVDPDLYPGSGNPRPPPTPQEILQEVQIAMQTKGWKASPSNYF